MSKIAQKLCKDLVEPVFGSYATCSYKRSSENFNYEDVEEKSNKLVNFEKKKVVNKILPRDTIRSKHETIKELKSKEAFLKKNLVDISINTIKSGPLKCDNNCVTMVRKREKCNCKIGQKRSSLKTCAKQVQTVDKRTYLRTDKACEQIVDTYTLGTQFSYKFNKNNTGIRSPHHSFTKTKSSSRIESVSRLKSKQFIKTKSELNQRISNDHIKSDIQKSADFFSKPFAKKFESQKSNIVYRENISNSANRPCNFSYINAKRWALSQYPTRGPDF